MSYHDIRNARLKLVVIETTLSTISNDTIYDLSVSDNNFMHAAIAVIEAITSMYHKYELDLAELERKT